MTRRTMRHVVLGLLWLGCGLGPASGAELDAAEPLDLTTAVGLALAQHPLAAGASADVAAADASRRQSTARLLPQIGLRESWARSDDPVFAFGALLEQGRFTEADFDVAKLNDPAALDHFRSKIALEQPIFSLPAWYDRSAAGAVSDAATAAETAVREGLALRVVESYVGLLLARDAVAVAEEAERAAAGDLRRARALVSAGTTLEADSLQADVHHRGTLQALETARGDARIAELALASLVGGGDVVGPLTSLPPSLDERARRQLGAGELEAALARRADLMALRHQREAAEAGASGARAALWPSIGLVASEQWDREQFGVDGEASYAVGVALDWNFLAGGGDLARVDAADAASAGARARLEARERQARLEIGTRDAQLATASGRAATAVGAASLANEAKRVIERRYEQGLATWTELVSAESAHSNARLGELTARYEVWLAWARREQALGRLQDSLVQVATIAADGRKEEP